MVMLGESRLIQNDWETLAEGTTLRLIKKNPQTKILMALLHSLFTGTLIQKNIILERQKMIFGKKWEKTLLVKWMTI